MFKQFLIWLFDGNINSKIPEELLSYKSPITHTYVISLFTKIGLFNHYLNEYFNNVGLYYLDKRDIFRYIKECVQLFKINSRQIRYAWFRKKSDLHKMLSKKHPNLKPYEISILCEVVNNLEDKNNIYVSLGLEKPKIVKTKKSKPGKSSNNSVESFISKNFVFERL